jgi:hypothetical protein
MSNIYYNGIPMIWITVDETLDGDWEASLSPEFKDYLIRADLWDGSSSDKELPQSVLTSQGGASAPPFFCARAPARPYASYPVPRCVFRR